MRHFIEPAGHGSGRECLPSEFMDWVRVDTPEHPAPVSRSREPYDLETCDDCGCVLPCMDCAILYREET